MEITLFYVPFGSADDAHKYGTLAIEKKLAACINVFPIASTYIWDGTMTNDKEYVLILKTLTEMKIPLHIFLEEEHPYDTPAILSWNVTVNETYGLWMAQQIQRKGS